MTSKTDSTKAAGAVGRMTSTRLSNGIHLIRRDGKAVGRAWKIPGKNAFELTLDGIYWHQGVANTRGGSTGIKVPRLKVAIALADKTLTRMVADAAKEKKTSPAGAAKCPKAAHKPCNEPCPKCGSADIARTFIAKGQEVPHEGYDKCASKYGTGQCHTWRATRDHIHHICRCCGYAWQGLPLKEGNGKVNRHG